MKSKHLIPSFLLFLATFPLSAGTLSNGALSLTVRDDNGAIDAIVFNGVDYFNPGTPVSDFGLQLGTDTSTFRCNTTGGSEQIPVSTTTAAGSILAAGTYNVGTAVTFERSYSLVAGQNAILITTTFTNADTNTAALRYFETFDPDHNPDYSTFNDVYSLGAQSVARATNGAGATFILGSTSSVTLAAGGPFMINSGNILNSFFSSPVDGNGANADSGVHSGYDFSLLPGQTRTLTTILAFGSTQAAAESAFNLAGNRPPVVTLNGANPITLECYVDFYTEYGATAVDPEDGPLTLAPIAGTVDRTHVGTYTR
ncbi:MAG: hypothetical protein KF712_19430, partial [Akkermansiaceae bacterium]|nr:hypothetical protein [Akkermansiaceae bacterium]